MTLTKSVINHPLHVCSDVVIVIQSESRELQDGVNSREGLTDERSKVLERIGYECELM